jgi:hypothetical protein
MLNNKPLNKIDWVTVVIVSVILAILTMVFYLIYHNTRKEKHILENTIDPRVSVTYTSRFNIYEFTLSDDTKCVALSTNSISCNWKN